MELKWGKGTENSLGVAISADMVREGAESDI